jgi:transcriptional regulator with XRE-family HTH domain
MTQEQIAQKLLDICNKSGMTRLEISEWLGVHERTLYRWLSGESPVPVSVMRAIELLGKGN